MPDGGCGTAEPFFGRRMSSAEPNCSSVMQCHDVMKPGIDQFFVNPHVFTQFSASQVYSCSDAQHIWSQMVCCWLRAARPRRLHCFLTPCGTHATQGFITAEAGPQGNVSISQLPPGVRLDAPWPLLRVTQQAQPHHLTYYPEARLYTLTVSRQVLWSSGSGRAQSLDIFPTVLALSHCRSWHDAHNTQSAAWWSLLGQDLVVMGQTYNLQLGSSVRMSHAAVAVAAQPSWTQAAEDAADVVASVCTITAADCSSLLCKSMGSAVYNAVPG